MMVTMMMIMMVIIDSGSGKSPAMTNRQFGLSISAFESVESELSLRECRDDYLNRNLRSAHLGIARNSPSRHLHERETDILPKVVDAAILWLRGRQMVI